MALNNATLIGRLTKDIDLRKTTQGTSVANFTLAVNDPYDKEDTDFIRCVAWGGQADFMYNYLDKGSLIAVSGKIKTGSYEDSETGKTIYTTEVNVRSVQALESKAEREARQQSGGMQQQRPRYQAPDGYASPQNQQSYQQPQRAAQRPQPDPTLDINSDDLPF